MDPVLRDWLRDVHPGLRSAACDLADLVADAVPDAALRLKYGCPMWNVTGADFCYLLRGGDRVSLGFQRGTEVDDPHGLLVALGNARDARHVVIREGEGVPAGTRRVLEQTATLARLSAR